MENSNELIQASCLSVIDELLKEVPLPEICNGLYNSMVDSYAAALEHEGSHNHRDIYIVRRVFEAFSKMAVQDSKTF